MHVGIDFGTTFSCIAYIDELGLAKVIPNSDTNDPLRNLTTPSVIWLHDGTAYIGEKANQRKISPSAPIFEFIKRDIGHPIDHIPGFPDPKPYSIDGFKYGAVGMAGIILRKLKKDALRHFKKYKIISENTDEKNFFLDAVITVPAYFGDKERQAVKYAGYIGGLNVIGIINEPTAASLTYGFSLCENKTLLVFDLGGGTFDVTILQMEQGNANVICSNGNKELGGKDWDNLIQDYLFEEFTRRTNLEIPESLFWDIQQMALKAKFELSECEISSIRISAEGIEEEIILYQNNPNGEELLSMDDDNIFYFKNRSSNLLTQIRTLCLSVLDKAKLKWDDVDEIVLAGGSCRMPMIPEMLESLSKKKIKKSIIGFNYDTAIAQGAAIYGNYKNRVRDIAPKTIGIRVIFNNRDLIEHIIFKDTQLPAKVEKRYKAGRSAVLDVYEGDSKLPDECEFRGRLELDNEDGEVTIILESNEDGVLCAYANYKPDGTKSMQIKENGEDINQRIELIRNKVQSLNILS